MTSRSSPRTRLTTNASPIMLAFRLAETIAVFPAILRGTIDCRAVVG